MLSERNLIVYGNGFTKSESEKDDIEELLRTYSNKRIKRETNAIISFFIKHLDIIIYRYYNV